MCSWSAGGRCRRHSSIRSRRGCGPAEGARGGRPPASPSFADAPSWPAGPPRARWNGLMADWELAPCGQRRGAGYSDIAMALGHDQKRSRSMRPEIRGFFGSSCAAVDSGDRQGWIPSETAGFFPRYLLILCFSGLCAPPWAPAAQGACWWQQAQGAEAAGKAARRGRQPRQPPATHPTPAAGVDISPSLKTPAGFPRADNAPTATRNHPRHPQPLCGRWRCSQPGHQAPHHRTPQRTGTVNRGAQPATSRRAAPPRGGSRRRRIQPRVWRAPHPALPSPPPPRQG